MGFTLHIGNNLNLSTIGVSVDRDLPDGPLAMCASNTVQEVLLFEVGFLFLKTCDSGCKQMIIAMLFRRGEKNA